MLVGIQQMRFNIWRSLNAVVSWSLKFQTSVTRWNFLWNVLHRTLAESGSQRGVIFMNVIVTIAAVWCMRWSSIDRRLKTKTCGDVEKRPRCMGQNMDNLFHLPFFFFFSIPIKPISNPFICLLRLRESGDAAQSGLTRHLTLSFAISPLNRRRFNVWPAKTLFLPFSLTVEYLQIWI